MLNLTPLLPVLPYLGWLLALLLLWLWLRPALTPTWVLSLVQSEGVASIRLAAAAVVVAYTMSMDAAARLSDAGRTEWLTFAAVLLGLGVAKVTAKSFARKPEPPKSPHHANSSCPPPLG